MTTKNNDKVTVKAPGCTFPVLSTLGFIFVLAKIFGVGEVATWSWAAVLSPFWLLPAIFLGIIALLLAIAAICGILVLIFTAVEGIYDYLKPRPTRLRLA